MTVQSPTNNKQKPFLSFGNFFPSEVVALVTDRNLDFARGNTSGDLPQRRKEFFSENLGTGQEKIVDIKQVHGRQIVLAVKGKIYNSAEPTEADGSITRDAGVPLAVRTADCLSVFIFDPRTKSIGLVHAGWRGTKEGIAARAVELMKKNFGAKPEELRVALGPAIRPCCYEVGMEFEGHFPSETFRKGESLFLDLPLVNKRQLTTIGVREEHVFDCALCTCCDERFFSFRREKEKAGRMISVMMLKPS